MEQVSIMDDAQQTPDPPAGPTMTKQRRLHRSCVLCHRRKIRCDKKSPCKNCSRADVLCYYPSQEQNVRRPHKTTISDVSARLARLERTIIAFSNDPTQNQNAIPVERPVTDDFNSIDPNGPLVEGAPSEEKLVQGSSSSRYINDVLLSRVMEEEQEIKFLIENQHAGSHCHDPARQDIDPLLSAFQKPSQGSGVNHPPRQCAIQLWQAFVNNVDPLFKILHIPSTQGIIYGAISNPMNVNARINSLLFAVYFAGAASLSSDQVTNLLGRSKITALNTFKQGLEQSLAAADFLDTPTLMTLQAITLYMFCFRPSSGGRAIWTLNGLVTRSAQCIGLHRDGTNFKLPPFECEMRRRLWWHIVANDSRVSEDHGIRSYTSDSATDVALPSNVNDSELYPTMNKLPTTKPEWTDMSFSLMVIEAYNVFRQLTLDASSNTSHPSELSRQQPFQTLKARFEIQYLQFCDQNIPIQRMAYLIGKLLPSKLDFVARQIWLRHHTSTLASTLATTTSLPATRKAFPGQETDLLQACEILEISEHFRTDEMLQAFQWNIRTYPQYHVLMFVFRYLCVAPESPSAERAWTLANNCFASESSYKVGWNWTVLSKLREKAMKTKNSASARGVVDIHETGLGYDVETESTVEVDVSDAHEAQLPSGMDWSLDAFDYLYWDSMNGNVDMGAFGP
ncbi:fungal-specific transcription factor domain-containing protein [Paraphoma chrysanthemicola]|uniref:Fungal-specific transcription factor domain-containing protein n=1 Tax=Paraphoma chrysanthemicola TaxID=798071 RepID=A0A8K0RDU4_9PLEO|nr:fungal-specific transcription factor domain-containing protein [Paraphoma chrysanthemicola]